MRSRLASVAFTLALVPAACAHGPERAGPAWTLTDPAGDDHGDGDLTYPGRGEPSPGELDLVALRAFPVKGGTELEVELARSVRRPDGRTVSSTGESLSELASLGFHTFNLDLYVDVDRTPGSGRTEALPGRKLSFDAAAAWDKAIVLTPRPADARSILLAAWTREAKRARGPRSMSGREEEVLEREVLEEAERRVFFATRVHVSGPTVRFFVPDTFLPGGARADLAYAAVVTGAKLDSKVDLRAIFTKDTPLPGLPALPIAPGHRIETFGGGRIDDPDQPPVVDLLAAGVQEEVLLARPPVLRPIVPGVLSR